MGNDIYDLLEQVEGDFVRRSRKLPNEDIAEEMLGELSWPYEEE